MKIFASLDTPSPPDPSQMLVGRSVANAAFLHALWRYGDFDAYHFFPGDHHDARRFQTANRPVIEALGLQDRVRLFSRFSLVDQLTSTPYHVFHQSDFVSYFAELCQLRSRHAVRRFPVTAPIHSISYPSYQETWLRLMLDGPAPYDAIICTSRAGRAAVDEGFRRVAAHPTLQPLELAPRMRRELIPLGTEVERFTPADDAGRREARRALGLPEDGSILLCLGRFSESDKYDLLPLLRAFQIALIPGNDAERAVFDGTTLVLAGARQGNNYPERLEQIAGVMGLSQRVQLRLDVSSDDQRLLYRAADLFVSPSDNLQETFGLSVLEAMAAGLPVVASDWDGYRDLVEPGVSGLLVPTYVGDWDGLLGELGPVSYQRPWHLFVAQATVIDVPELARALRALLLSPGQRIAFGEAGRRRALELDWSKVITRYLALWETLSAEAAVDTRPPPAPSPFAHPPFRLFPAHPTRALTPDDLLSLTHVGEALLLAPETRPWYQEIDPLFDPVVVRHLCALARRGCRLGDAVRLVADGQCQSEERVRYQLAWLIKQDLLRVEPPESKPA
jgi:glycosyltransferase involved in cell wall biosynthesis